LWNRESQNGNKTNSSANDKYYQKNTINRKEKDYKKKYRQMR
jgi:hypothetical protein